jgi:O-antigen/teichoic acid export membrane protein
MSLRSQAASGVKWTTLASAVTTVLQFVRLAVLARLLVAEDFGLMAMVLVVVGFGQAFADMGFSNAIIHRQDSTRQQLSSLYWLNLVAGFAVALLVFASAPLMVSFYGEPRLADLMVWAALIFVITPLGQQFQILLQKELRFSALAKIEIAAALAGTITAVWAALLGQGVFSLIWGQLVDTAFRSFLPVWAGWRDWRPQLHFKAQDLAGYLAFGLYQMGERSITYFNTRLDQILIGALVGTEALGYYSLAFNLVIVPVSKINPVITRVAFPVFARMQSDTARLRRGYLTVVRVLAMVNFPLLLGLMAVAPTLVVQVFGAEWQPAVVLVQLLALVALLRSPANPIGSLLLAKGRADLGFTWNLMLLFTQLPGIYLGARLGGSEGVALALIALQLVYTVFSYRLLVRAMVGPGAKAYVMTMAPSFALAAVMAAVVAGLEAVFSLGGLILLAAQIALGATVYLGLASLVMKDDIMEVRNFLSRRAEPNQPNRAVNVE